MACMAREFSTLDPPDPQLPATPYTTCRPLCEGVQLAAAWAEAGIDCTVITDAQARLGGVLAWCAPSTACDVLPAPP